MRTEYELATSILGKVRDRNVRFRWLFIVLLVALGITALYLMHFKGTNILSMESISQGMKGDLIAAILLSLTSVIGVSLVGLFFFDKEGASVHGDANASEATEQVLRLDAAGDFEGGLDAVRVMLGRIYDGESGPIRVVDATREAYLQEALTFGRATTLSADQDRRLVLARAVVENRNGVKQVFEAALGLFRGGGFDSGMTREYYALFANELRFATGLAQQPSERTIRAALIARDWPRDGLGSNRPCSVPVCLTPSERDVVQARWDEQLAEAGLELQGGDRRSFTVPAIFVPNELVMSRLLAPAVVHLVRILATVRPVERLNWIEFSRALEQIRSGEKRHEALGNLFDWVLLLPGHTYWDPTGAQSLLTLPLPPTGPKLGEWLAAQTSD